MSLKKELWRITPEDLPRVKRNCQRCKEKREFINSKKFRVNANGKSIDVWLIYRCENCGASWNMAIYERKDVESFNREEYLGFLDNASGLVQAYGRNMEVFAKNKAQIFVDSHGYKVERTEREEDSFKEDGLEIELFVPLPIKLKVESLLADQLHMSRSAVRRWCIEGSICKQETEEAENTKTGNKEVYREKVKNGLVIIISHSHISFPML